MLEFTKILEPSLESSIFAESEPDYFIIIEEY